MKVEKWVEYAGFKVVIVKDIRLGIYLLKLDTNINYREFLAQALEMAHWQIDLPSFIEGRPVWFKSLQGPTHTALNNEMMSHIEELYREHRKIDFEEQHKKRERLFGPDPEGD